MYYLRRIKQLGISGIKMIINRELTKKKFAHSFHQRALNKQASITWMHLEKKYSAPPFDIFLQTMRDNKAFEHIMSHPRFIHFLPSHISETQQLFKQADNICDGSYEFLGAQLAHKGNLLWHHDTKSSSLSSFEPFAHEFYQNIQFTQHTANNQDNYAADIKIPWERSRMHHLFILGWAYRTTQDKQSKERYVRTMQQHLSDWLEKNPFLLGVNWLCPMDVAIRATNILWTLELFKQSSENEPHFFKRVICSLYDHLTYLEANWEQSDKPNNHYIADLTGALYLALFFKDFKGADKRIKAIQQKLNAQYSHQLLSDGTSYEGSTAYHRLITEMHLHYTFLSEAFEEVQLQNRHHIQEKKMLQFLVDASYSNHNIIHIGDDDSGKFVAGLAIQAEAEKRTIHYQDFGVSIIIKNNWHISLRHPTYSPHQPSGHFHQDELSITIAYKGIPIIVDPGSYNYTGSPFWRNQFRSSLFHNGISLLHSDEIKSPLHQDLFQLNRQQSSHTADALHYNHEEHIQTYTRQQHPTPHEKKRKLIVAPQNIQWHDKVTCTNRLHQWSFYWTLIIHPTILVSQKNTHEWTFYYQKKPLTSFTSSLTFKKTSGSFAPHYGIKQACTRLIAQAPCVTQEHEFALFLANTKQGNNII